MDDYMDYGCDDYFDTHDVDDLMEWENEAVFQDMVAEREDDRSAWDDEYESNDDEYYEEEGYYDD